MKKISSLLYFITLVAATFGQPGVPVGHLTIFSEDGDRFQLYLNGELMNDVPQVNLRVEDLRQPYYNARIVFEDKSRGDITKNNLMIADADGTFVDVTYKIKRDKNLSTKMKLNYFSATPVVPDFIPPTNVHVVHFGQPQMAGTRGMTQTTTTTTTSQGGTIGAQVNLGGVNMGITIADPEAGMVTTRTTTTTSSSGTGGVVIAQNASSCTGRLAMSSANFSNALATVRKQSFDDTKLSTVKQVASANCLSVGQISQLASLITFEDSKLEFAKFAYDRCTDPTNYFNLNNIFSFSSNVESLNEYINSRR
jgi:hypothetical protein